MFSLSYAAQLANKIYDTSTDEYNNTYIFRVDSVVNLMKKLSSFNNSIIDVKQDLMFLTYLQYVYNVEKTERSEAFISNIPPYYSTIIEEFLGKSFLELSNMLPMLPVMLKPLITSEITYHKKFISESTLPLVDEALTQYALKDDLEIINIIL